MLRRSSLARNAQFTLRRTVVVYVTGMVGPCHADGPNGRHAYRCAPCRDLFPDPAGTVRSPDEGRGTEHDREIDAVGATGCACNVASSHRGSADNGYRTKSCQAVRSPPHPAGTMPASGGTVPGGEASVLPPQGAQNSEGRQRENEKSALGVWVIKTRSANADSLLCPVPGLPNSSSGPHGHCSPAADSQAQIRKRGYPRFAEGGLTIGPPGKMPRGAACS